MMKLGGGKCTGIELSSRLHQVCTGLIPLVKQGYGYNVHCNRNAGTVPTWVLGVDPACHLSQIWLAQASDPQRWVCGNSPSGLGNKQLMLFIYLEMGSFQ